MSHRSKWIQMELELPSGEIKNIWRMSAEVRPNRVRAILQHEVAPNDWRELHRFPWEQMPGIHRVSGNALNECAIAMSDGAYNFLAKWVDKNGDLKPGAP